MDSLNKNDIDIVIYHGYCPDGIVSAWIIHRKFPDAKFIGMQYTSIDKFFKESSEELKNKNVIVVDRKPKSKTVLVGSYLKVKSLGGTFGSGQVEKFIIVGSSEASPIEGKISNESPLGRAFLGHKVKDTVEVAVPKGKRKYKILSIE